MKKLFVMLLLISLAAPAIAQQTEPAPGSREDLLQKSRQQKTLAWVLVGGGVVMLGGAAIWAGSDWNAKEPDVLAVAGGAAILSSIPLFIASSRNKRKAASISFRTDRLPGMLPTPATVSSVTLKLPLGR